MKTQTDNKENYLDKGLSLFVRKYRYELIASFSLVALILGITVGAIFFKQAQSKVVLKTTSESAQSLNKERVVYVDIAGAVKSPGLYSFTSSNARIKYAIERAGGLTKSADLTWINRYINMAELLVDGQKLYIPSVGDKQETGNAGSKSTEGAKININHATKAQLKSLPGIGDVYAQRIIDNRPYQKPSDLLKVSGIGSKTYSKIKDLIEAP